jgi:hypothetical protein
MRLRRGTTVTAFIASSVVVLYGSSVLTFGAASASRITRCVRELALLVRSCLPHAPLPLALPCAVLM